MVRQFQHYADLSEADIELLDSLEHSPEQLPAERTVWREGGAANELAVLSEGWACSYYTLEDGSRLILDIYLPGDVIGLREFATSEHMATVETITECTLCRFPHHHLTDVFAKSFKLTRTFFAIATTQQSILVERMINLGRRNASNRIAHFLCEMYTRLGRMNDNMNGNFRMPLSQEMLADIMGLSSVHVSRTFSQLHDDKLVERSRHNIRIPDMDRLVEHAGFTDNYLGTRSIIENRA
ncbi:Crp/Fnr family transcriptional regulator [Kushneria phosphatilytica]|uniref:Crp/Fnr family transcriptional regulator n=2 Tax=Kushneria phosphatilytica TaxID=657387 RepID=A0A1S1NTM0_9GAMM|nr:Crp/Fnr family transcriptional regulator [Kushneria phosphatilytica]QEL12921.1 Crp/Fnr family transcriptional regulator [Kushneria phosphatilytica]